MRGEPGLSDRLAAAAEEALLSSWRRRPQALAAIAIVAASLAFPAALVLLLDWSRDVADDLASRQRVRVFLFDDATDEETAVIEQALRASPGITRVGRVSAEQGRADLLARFPELAAAVASLGDELTLPRVIEARGDGAPGTLAGAARAVEGLPGVEEARHDADAAARLARVRSALAAASTGIALVALAITGAVISNVVRIGALSRREQLAVMRLVGAPRFHVRAPFVLEGALQGGLGGLAAAGMLALARAALGAPLAQALPASAAGLGARAWAVLIIAPCLTGALAAWWVVESVLRRHARLER